MNEDHAAQAESLASRFARFGWIAFLVLCATWPLRAHNSELSFATMRVTGDILRVELEMSGEAAMALLGVPLGTQGTPPHREDLLPPLAKVAPGAFRFSIADTVLKPSEARVEFREDDGVAFVLDYALPAELPDPPRIMCEALCLDAFGAFHRMRFNVLDRNGNLLHREILRLDHKSAVLPVPM